MTGIIANFRNRTLSRDGVTISCGPVTFRIVTALLAARCPLTTRELVGHVYGDDLNGGPDLAGDVIIATIFYARRGRWHLGHFIQPPLWMLGATIVSHGATKGHLGYTIEISDLSMLAEAAE